MARFLLKSISAHLPFPSTLQAAATRPLSVLLRCLSTSFPSAFHPTPVLRRNRLLLPFSPQPFSFQGFSADLVDNGICNLSHALSHTDDREVAAGPEESAEGGDDGEMGFDEIEDMRVRRKLFYKMDRDSKEYEECSIRFHKTKSARNREKVSDRKDKSKGGMVSRGGGNDGVGHCGSKLGVIDGEKKERGETRKLGRDSGGDGRQKLRKREDLKDELMSGDDWRIGLGCTDAKTGLFDKRKMEKPKHGLASESRIVGTNMQLINDEQKEGSDAKMVPQNRNRNQTSSLIMEDTRFQELNNSPLDECVAAAQKNSIEGKRVRALTYNQLTDPYHQPFCLDIYITKGSVRACIIHRVSSKVVVVAHSISKDMKFDLMSRKDTTACAAVGSVLAQRAIADDIHNVVYTPRKGERIEGKLHIVLQSIIDNGIDVKLKIKKRRPFKISLTN